MKTNEAARDMTAIDSCAVGAAIWQLARRPGFVCQKTASGLIDLVEEKSGRLPHGFPRSPESVSRRLRRLRKSFERVGINIEFDDRRSGGQRWIRIATPDKDDLPGLLRS